MSPARPPWSCTRLVTLSIFACNPFPPAPSGCGASYASYGSRDGDRKLTIDKSGVYISQKNHQSASCLYNGIGGFLKVWPSYLWETSKQTDYSINGMLPSGTQEQEVRSCKTEQDSRKRHTWVWSDYDNYDEKHRDSTKNGNFQCCSLSSVCVTPYYLLYMKATTKQGLTPTIPTLVATWSVCGVALVSPSRLFFTRGTILCFCIIKKMIGRWSLPMVSSRDRKQTS